MLDKVKVILRKTLFFAVFPAAFFVFLFFLGEQFEVGRLGAIASCEGNPNPSACIRSKGYLPSAPHYPDLGRRYLGAMARAVGGDLGASYKEPVPAADLAAGPPGANPAAGAAQPGAPAAPAPAGVTPGAAPAAVPGAAPALPPPTPNTRAL
ncbi:MAG: hypothetical protein RLZZ166_86 [Pseudomonadota bacterium]|jgi:hypothetical protein